MTREEALKELRRLYDERMVVSKAYHEAAEAVRKNAEEISKIQNKLVDLEIEAAT